MTIDEALDLSLARLQMMALARRRVTARNAMLDLNIAIAGPAASRSKGGERCAKKLRAALEKESRAR